MRKYICVLAAGILLLATSCSQSTSDENSRKSHLSFSWFIGYSWFSPPNAWGKDPVSGWLQKNRHVDVQWISGRGDSSSLFNRLFSDPDFPDVMCIDRGPAVSRLIGAGLLLPLDSYLDRLPNLKKWAGSENLNLLRYTDGKLYQFPNWYISPGGTTAGGNSGWAINTTYVNEGKIIANNRLPEEKQDYMIKWQSEIIWKTSLNENAFAYQHPSSDSEIGMIQTKIADLYDDAATKAVFAHSDAEVLGILNTAQQEMNSAGYQRFLEYHKEKYHERV